MPAALELSIALSGMHATPQGNTVLAHLDSAAVLPMQVDKVIALQQLIGELSIADASFRAQAGAHGVLCKHGPHAGKFADLHKITVTGVVATA